MTRLAALPNRSVLEITGEDRVEFLQGLVSNDVAQAAPGRAVWAAMLTPQGKYVADFFIVAEGERLLLDLEASRAALVETRLARFRLRSRVGIAPSPLAVYAGWDGEPPASGLVAPDPRLPEAGFRFLDRPGLATTAQAAEYDAHRIRLGLPDGSRDIEPDKSVLLEAGFDELNGVSWTKGCYLGQELTARTRYRGLVKRRLVPVVAAERLAPEGTPVMADGIEAGLLRSTAGTHGLATLRLDRLSAPLTAGGIRLAPAIPDWMRLPDAAA